MPRGTCWKGYVQKGMKMKNGRSVPNCVPVQKAYLGRAVKQPSETENEFKIRHEYHTPFKEPQKANNGKIIKIKPQVSISKGSYQPDPKVNVGYENKFFGVGGEYNLIDSENTKLKITGNVGKGSGRANVQTPYGKETFKDQSPTEKNFMLTLEQKFLKGGLIKGKPKLALRGWK